MHARRLLPLLGLFLAVFFAAPAAFATEPPREPVECTTLTFPVKWSYCVYAGEDDGARVVYFFHGLGQSEKTWGEAKSVGALLRDHWRLEGKKRPTVIAISFGPQWLVARRGNGSKFGGLLEALPSLIVPMVEKKLAKAPEERVLLGESMGGFNASQVAFKLPTLFSRVAMLCPPIAEISPFADEAAIAKFVEETGAKRELVEGAAKLTKAFFPTEEAWAEANPLNLVAKAEAKAVPPLQVTCGSRDEYGFYPGARKFALIGRGRSLDLQWRSLLAGHCAMDTKSTSEFLLAR